MKEKSAQRICWVWFVYFVQFLFVFWYVQGSVPFHPIVVLLPLVGLLNTKFEKRGPEGLGLRRVKTNRTLFLAMFYGALSLTGGLICLYMEGCKWMIPIWNTLNIWTLLKTFLVCVFVLALWEELLSRGFIQTRLQAAWGFYGVIVSSLLFSCVHIPSTLLTDNYDIDKVVLRVIQTGLAGFAFGYVYWWTRSVVTTIAIHGLNNFFTTEILPLLGGMTVEQLLYRKPEFLLPWLFIQTAVLIILCRAIFRQADRFRIEDGRAA